MKGLLPDYLISPGVGQWAHWITVTLHCTALHFTALHCTALHCTALHCNTCHTALKFTVYSVWAVNDPLMSKTLRLEPRRSCSEYARPSLCSSTTFQPSKPHIVKKVQQIHFRSGPYLIVVKTLNQASFCHHKVYASPFSQQTKAHAYLSQYCDLLDLWLKNIHDSPNKYLANAIFGTSLAFQVREQMRLEKIIVCILDLNLGRFLRYTICNLRSTTL